MSTPNSPSNRPAKIEPKEVNDVRLIEIGIALWTITFVGFAIFLGPGRPMAVAFCGIGLGFWGRRYAKRRRARLKN